MHGNGVLSWFLCENRSAWFLSEKATDRAVATLGPIVFRNWHGLCACRVWWSGAYSGMPL
ncbi:hypothetical protein Taro_009990 [Colocasia esculenta]|uniref:Uncharacterized protein n=1 Tax=Colocasia esculenta TaxID=4460 RepID=A0A843U214_COLES|nr:hypothetical protein [Colocasia esculenta]